MSHDPRREVEKLRGHLASHQRPIALLIGAGASCAALGTDGAPLVPAVAALSTACEAAAHASTDAVIYDAIRDELETSIGPARVINIEDILSDVRRKLSAMGPADVLAGGDLEGLERIESLIQQTIATAAVPNDARIPTELPHHSLARWASRVDRAHPVEVFTTNWTP